MSKTIEAQLIALNNAREAHNRRNTDETFYEIIVAKAAIIADWNAALAAMKAVEKQATALYGEWQPCLLCGTGMMGHMADCAIPQLQAAIAAMEGNSPSHDEVTPPLSDEYRERVVKDDHHSAMVEDKRYERDDIYKK